MIFALKETALHLGFFGLVDYGDLCVAFYLVLLVFGMTGNVEGNVCDFC